MGRWEIQVDEVSQQGTVIKETGICQYPERSVASQVQQDCRPRVRTGQQPRSRNKGKGTHLGSAVSVNSVHLWIITGSCVPPALF